MARIQISTDSYVIRRIRREYKQVGHTIRVKYERIFTMKLPEYTYSRTIAQEECRERFRRAQEMMIEEFKSPERQRYWQQRAKREKYKTAKGCCKAHFYHKIVDMDLEEEWKQSNVAMRERREAIARGETGEKEFNKVRTFWYRAKCYGTESADEMKAKRLASGVDRYEKMIERGNINHELTSREIYVVTTRTLDDITLDEVEGASHLYMRNGPRNISICPDMFASKMRKNLLDKYILTCRREQCKDMGIFMKHLYGKLPYGKEEESDKIILTSEIYPQFAERQSIRVTLEQLQKHDYNEELKSHDIYVVVAGRTVFLNAELIHNLRKYSYLKKIRGVTHKQLERLRKLIAHRRKSAGATSGKS